MNSPVPPRGPDAAGRIGQMSGPVCQGGLATVGFAGSGKTNATMLPDDIRRAGQTGNQVRQSRHIGIHCKLPLNIVETHPL